MSGRIGSGAAAVAGFLFLTATVAAQEAVSPANDASAAAAETERVIVTGSNIPALQTAAEVGPNPVQAIGRYTIEKSGERNTEQLLRDLPVANANGVSPAGLGGGVIAEGAASISLRGLDPGATLVLLNGRRVAPYPTGTLTGAEFFVDLNTIPRAAIDAIEILKDGASTTCGADAIAGVVNFKLRHDYRGAEVNVEYGNTTTRNSAEHAASLVFGVGDDKTSVTGVLNYYSRDAILRSDRYDRDAGVRLSNNSNPFNLEVSRTAAEVAAGRPITEIDPAIDTFFAHAPVFTDGHAPASNYVFTNGYDPANAFNINPYQTEVPETERYGAYLNAEHKIFGEQLVAYGDILFQRADATVSDPPPPTFHFATPGQAPVTPIAIPPATPGLIVGGLSYADVGLPPGAYNPFNPFPQIISGNSQARLMEFSRRFEHRTDSFITTLGVRGDRLFDGSWGYDASFRYSRMEVNTNITTASSSRFQRTLNAADPIFDPASPEFIGTTVPYNPFGDYRVPIPNNFRFRDFVTIHPHERDVGTLRSFDLNIYSTHLFDLPAGPVGVAFGAQFVHETNDQVPDAILRAGDELGVGGVFSGAPGSTDSYAGYAETSIPVFGANFRALGLHALDFTAAVRFEAFSNDTNVTVPKFGVRWQPLDESLTVRATWGEGFKVPSIVELSAPTIDGVVDVFDPVKQKFHSELPTTFLGNPHLQPEDSRNFTAGIVYSPKVVPRLTLTIDLFNIETNGWIDPNPDPAGIIERIESGHAAPGESTTRDANGNLTHLSYVPFTNTGTQKVRGADFSLVYELPTSIGTFCSTTQATYIDSYQFSSLPGVKERERLRMPVDDFSDDAYLQWKGSSRLDWIWRGFSAATTARYWDGFHEIDLNGNEHWVRQTWLFDLQVSYDVGTKSSTAPPERFHHGWPRWRTLLDGTKLTIGVNNIFDHDPPHAVDNFPRFIYDTTGRFIYASLTKKF